MRKSEKFRKLSKLIQYGGMIIILVGGMFVLYFFGLRKASDGNPLNSGIITFMLGIMVLLLAFTVFVLSPMTLKLIKLTIIDSLEGLVSELTFNSKKGFTKETFESFNVGIDKGEDYNCQDYFSFKYKDIIVESATINYFTNIKIAKKEGKKKNKKAQVKQFFGRVFVIPYNNKTQDELSILGKYNPSFSKTKTMKDYSLLTTKVKKYTENFEVFYKEKPTMNVQSFLDSLFSLKMQAKAPVSAIIRKKSIVLCIDNHKSFEEIDIKKPIDENIYRTYRKDISMVLTFIDMISKD